MTESPCPIWHFDAVEGAQICGLGGGDNKRSCAVVMGEVMVF